MNFLLKQIIEKKEGSFMNFIDKESIRAIVSGIISCIVAYYTVKNIETLTLIFEWIKNILGL